MFDRKRTPTLKRIKEELQCLFGYHKHCIRHYEKKGAIQYVYCQGSGKLIKKQHQEDSPLKIRFTRN